MGSIRVPLFAPKAHITVQCSVITSFHFLTSQSHSAVTHCNPCSYQGCLANCFSSKAPPWLTPWHRQYMQVCMCVCGSLSVFFLSLLASSSLLPGRSWSSRSFRAPASVSKITLFFVRLCLLRLVSMTAAFNPIREHGGWEEALPEVVI